MTVRFDRSWLRDGFGRSDALALLEAGFVAVDPATLVRSVVSRSGDRVLVSGRAYPVDDRRVWIVAVGKASVPMADAVGAVLGGALAGGVAVTPYGYGGDVGAVRVFEAGHPLPDKNGLYASKAVAALASSLGAKDLVFCLVSGGGSALLASPPAGVSVEDLAEVTRLLLSCGASIDEINVVRRHVSTLQGGQLARLLQPASTVTLILSDVVSGAAEAVASGPTIPDSTRFEDARSVLRRYRLWDRIPGTVRAHVNRGIDGAVSETAKPLDPAFQGADVRVVGDNGTFVDAVCRSAAGKGYEVRRLGAPLIGEARDVGQEIGRQAAQFARRGAQRLALVGGGETTVTVREPGVGGRNQNVALAAALEIDGREALCVAAVGTDGTDGPTDAAGAVVDASTVARARQRGFDATAALEENNAYPVLAATGDLLITGPTRTNVADVCLVLVGAARR